VHRLAAVLMVVGLMVADCGWKPPGMAPQRSDTCTNMDGPTTDTVRRAIATLPVAMPGSSWTEAAHGHTHNCRLYWVQVEPSAATASSAEQLLFFDHNTPLGTPTPNPKPYTTVLYSTDDTVRVQYQWQVAGDSACCPTGIGSAEYQLGVDGKLSARGPIPNQ
jgi:hypothetical protein